MNLQDVLLLDERRNFQAKPAPSVTSLNRELSTVSYDYDQLNAILGPYTMRRLIAHSKVTVLASTESRHCDLIG